MTLGRRIRTLRVADPYMTQRQLAAAAGLTLMELVKIEGDQTKPSLMTLGRITVALHATSADLGVLADDWNNWEAAPPLDISDAAFVCRRRS